MKLSLFATILSGMLSFCACSSETAEQKAEGQQDSTVTAAAMTVVKFNKQMVTNTDGSVVENAVDVELGYNDKELKVTFKNDDTQSFALEVASIETKPEGTTIKVKDRKYSDVFIAAGDKAQAHFNAVPGSPSMGFMQQ